MNVSCKKTVTPISHLLHIKYMGVYSAQHQHLFYMDKQNMPVPILVVDYALQSIQTEEASPSAM